MGRPPLSRRARRVARAAGESLARRAGFELVKRHFYSPLPDVDSLPPELWLRPVSMAGVDMRIESALELLERMAPFLAEFRPPLEPVAGRNEFHMRNGTYENVDADTLYALLRHYGPARVMELGSGNSSLVTHAARQRNSAEGRPFEHAIFDPFPAETVHALGGVAVSELGVRDIAPAEYEKLASGDVLFVDTTHTVRTGGDVTAVILEVLPRLAPGVLVHFHDIFLPYEYPREWVVDRRRAWAEQYLLHAFLAFNKTFEVILPTHAVWRAAPGALRRLIPTYGGGGTGPGAFWIRRREE